MIFPPIDPSKGLFGPVIQPTAMVDSIGQQPGTRQPEASTLKTSQSSPPPAIGSTDSANLAPNKKTGLLDSVIFALLGTPEALLTDQEISKKKGKRSEAGALSKSAAENPGEAYMGIPSGGGSSLSTILSTIARIV